MMYHVFTPPCAANRRAKTRACKRARAVASSVSGVAATTSAGPPPAIHVSYASQCAFVRERSRIMLSTRRRTFLDAGPNRPCPSSPCGGWRKGRLAEMGGVPTLGANRRAKTRACKRARAAASSVCGGLLLLLLLLRCCSVQASMRVQWSRVCAARRTIEETRASTRRFPTSHASRFKIGGGGNESEERVSRDSEQRGRARHTWRSVTKACSCRATL